MFDFHFNENCLIQFLLESLPLNNSIDPIDL